MTPKYRTGNEVISTCGKYHCLIVEVKAHTYIVKALNYTAATLGVQWETSDWSEFDHMTKLLTPLEKLI